MCFGVQQNKVYTKQTIRKTNSAAHAAVRTAVSTVLKMRKKGKRKGSALDMELRFTVSEKHFLIT
jgi:hypothetical protein